MPSKLTQNTTCSSVLKKLEFSVTNVTQIHSNIFFKKIQLIKAYPNTSTLRLDKIKLQARLFSSSYVRCTWQNAIEICIFVMNFKNSWHSLFSIQLTILQITYLYNKTIKSSRNGSCSERSTGRTALGVFGCYTERFFFLTRSKMVAPYRNNNHLCNLVLIGAVKGIYFLLIWSHS